VVTIDDVISRVRREMRGKLPADVELGPDTGLADLGMSSLQVSEVVFSLEEDHGFEFDAARAAELKTIGEVVALANESLAAKTSS
jgi:acyl carrier protein